jgi:uncharacterized OB-fold protein
MPMLEDDEWASIAPLLSIETQKEACERYYQITGFYETNINAIAHHDNRLLGPDCKHCGKPYRTPKAKYCFECGDGIE